MDTQSLPNEEHLSKLTISGYKSISKDFPVELELGDITLLLGANGSGKSNILGFFKLVGLMMVGELQRYVEMAGTSQTFLHYGAQRTPQLSAELRYETPKREDTYEFTLSHATSNRLIFNEEHLHSKDKASGTISEVQLSPNFRESALLNVQDETALTLRNNLQRTKYYQFHDSSLDGPLRRPAAVDTAPYLQAQGGNLAAFLYHLQQHYAASYRQIVSYVRDVVPTFRDFYLEPSNGMISLRWQDDSLNDYVLLPEQFSDGSIRFIALATLLLQPTEKLPRVVIIDEPELGLHPTAISALAQMINAASLHCQVLVSTQSKDLIDHFEADQIAVVEMDAATHSTRVKQLSTEELAVWLEEYTISELWDKNIIGGKP